MVTNPADESAKEDMQPKTYTGGIRWRKLTNVSAPLGRLTIDSTGIVVEPSTTRLPLLWKILGIPTLHWHWREITEVRLVKGPFAGGNVEGIFFVSDGRRLVFGCDSAAAKEIGGYAAQFIPDRVMQDEEPKMVF